MYVLHEHKYIIAGWWREQRELQGLAFVVIFLHNNVNHAGTILRLNFPSLFADGVCVIVSILFKKIVSSVCKLLLLTRAIPLLPFSNA